MIIHDFSSSPIAQSPLIPGDRLGTSDGGQLLENSSGLTPEPGILFSANYGLLGVILLLTSTLTGWQWFRSWQKIKQLQREKQQQADSLTQASLTLQEHLNGPELNGAKILALDYLRMRLDEEIFRYQIIHQVQEQLTNLVTQLVKSTLPETPTTKQVLLDRLIEIEYDLEGLEGKWYRCTVLQIHVQLRKLPLQSSSSTVRQMVEAITLFMGHPQGQSEWKTPLQEQWLGLRWESSNHPLPLLNLQNYPAKSKELPDSPGQLSTHSPVPTESSSSPRRESFAHLSP